MVKDVTSIRMATTLRECISKMRNGDMAAITSLKDVY